MTKDEIIDWLDSVKYDLEMMQSEADDLCDAAKEAGEGFDMTESFNRVFDAVTTAIEDVDDRLAELAEEEA